MGLYESHGLRYVAPKPAAEARLPKRGETEVVLRDVGRTENNALLIAELFSLDVEAAAAAMRRSGRVSDAPQIYDAEQIAAIRPAMLAVRALTESLFVGEDFAKSDRVERLFEAPWIGYGPDEKGWVIKTMGRPWQTIAEFREKLGAYCRMLEIAAERGLWLELLPDAEA